MRRSFGKILIGVVVFGLCLGAAFGAGTVYGRHSITPSARAAGNPSSRTAATVAASTSSVSTAAASSGDATATSGSRGRGGFAFGGFGNRPLQGTVSSISPQQLALSIGTNNATTTTVALDAQTVYALAQSATQSALKSGDSVDVTTTTASDGTISAQSVIVVPKVPTPATQATPSASGTNGSAGTGGFGSGAGRTFGSGGAASRSIDGTIASITGNQLNITTASGSSTTVSLSNQTTYQTTQSAEQSAVTSGTSVIVTVSRGNDGSLTATSVIVLPKTS
ncbi:MAG TPA: DUF5666 domain-containing protein [Nitrolancea sp.]|nr:DUF5666 domain-containing protein [Nitrolancea sp.]